MAIIEQTETAQATQTKSLREHVLDSLKRYFGQLDGNKPFELKNLVLEEVESALYEAVMIFTRGNQSQAAKVLGVSRGTLRTKLKTYFGTTHVGLVDQEK